MHNGFNKWFSKKNVIMLISMYTARPQGRSINRSVPIILHSTPFPTLISHIFDLLNIFLFFVLILYALILQTHTISRKKLFVLLPKLKSFKMPPDKLITLDKFFCTERKLQLKE